MKVKATQSSLTLIGSIGCILQARILEWEAVPFSKESSPPRDRTQVPRIAGSFFTCVATRNRPRNEEMLSCPLLFSQRKASQEYAFVFCDVFHCLCYLLIFFHFNVCGII